MKFFESTWREGVISLIGLVLACILHSIVYHLLNASRHWISSISSSNDYFLWSPCDGKKMSSGGIRGDIIIIIHFLIPPITFISTYFIATSLGHVDKIFPYISDTGTKSPESCLFAFLLAIYSMTTLICVHARWRIVANRSLSGRAIPRLNNVGIFCGFAAALGALIVGCFQETNLLIVHLVGAGMIFLFGIIYLWLQTIITYMQPFSKGNSYCLCHLRLLLTILTTGCTVAFPTLGILAYFQNNTDRNWDLARENESESYKFHISSTSLEWGVVGLLCFYFLTFVAEFRHIRIGMPVIHTEPSNTGFSQMELNGYSEGSNKF